MNLISDRVVFFDFETGGLTPAHPNTQLAAAAVRLGTFEILEEFERKIQFDPAKCDPEALRINGYTPEAWIGAQPESVVVEHFDDFLRRHLSLRKVSKRTGRPYDVAMLAGHNVADFDCPRLQAAFKRANRFLPAGLFEALDTKHAARWLFVTGGYEIENVRLETLARYFGLDEQEHDAMSDVRLNIEVARRLTGKL